MNEATPRQVFSRLLLALSIFWLFSVAAQLLIFLPLLRLIPGFTRHSWFPFVISALPMWLVGFPCAWLVLKTLPAADAVRRPMDRLTLGRSGGMAAMTLIAGQMTGLIFMNLLGRFFGADTDNTVAQILENSDLAGLLLFSVLLPPLLEELLFRGLIYDRLALFGPRCAVVGSALLFGFFHGNFYQFFYAFGVGLVLGWLKCRSGRLGWGIALHMAVNFCGSVIPYIGTRLTARNEALAAPLTPDPGQLLLTLYAGCLLALAFYGLWLWEKRRSFFTALTPPSETPGLAKAALLNPGAAVFAAVTLLSFAVNL